MTSPICPRCKRDSMSDGVCLHCGPDADASVQQPHEPRAVSAGWTGFDRDLGAKKREERERQAREAEAQTRRRRVRAGAWGSTVVAAFVIGGIAWLWGTGRLHRDVDRSRTLPTGSILPAELPGGPGVPMALKGPASAARTELSLLGRELLEFTADTEKKFVGEAEASPADVDRFRARLKVLRDASRAMEPRLTREETRILMAFEHAEKMLDAYLKAIGGDSPDMAGLQVEAAQEQIKRGLAVARGEKVDSLVVVYAKKASAASELQKALDNP